MEYYDLIFDDHDDSPYWHLGIMESELQQWGGDIWSYSRGEWCRDPRPVPCHVCNPGVEADFNDDALTTAPIVSSRLAQLLSDVAPNDIQLIPAELNARGKWYLVNILPILDVFDYDNSIVTYRSADHPTRGDKPDLVARLIIDTGRIGPHHMFRPKEWQVAIIVSEEVRHRCDSARMSNMKFIPTNLQGWERYFANPDDDGWCFRPWRIAK